MSATRHIRKLLMKSKGGVSFTLETDLFNYEIAQQFRGSRIEEERNPGEKPTKDIKADDGQWLTEE